MTKSRKTTPQKQVSWAPKESKLFHNLYKTAQQFISGKGFTSSSEAELRQRLKIPEQHADIFHHILHEMVNNNILELENGRYSLKRASADVVKGVLRVHPRGFGFLQPLDPLKHPEEVFIPKHLTQNAVDGDTVEVLINQDSVSEKGPEGKVINILSRARTRLVGVVQSREWNGDCIAYVPLLGTSQRVIVRNHPEIPAKVGDRLALEVEEWGSKDTDTICTIAHFLGHISDPSKDIDVAIEEYELNNAFPQQVIDEAKSLGKQVSRTDLQGREDLRKQECFTIDPDTAKDFDDAITLTKSHKGHYHLGVHIADVSHYVAVGTALDEEARRRCNSTYFPGRCIPMLPSELSDNLCSLKPNVNRLTISVFVDFDENGNQLSYRISRSVIKSAKRFTYREAKEILDGKKKSKHADALKLMVELCGLLKKKRYERGSLEFAIPELVILVDKNGVPTGTDYVEYDITHQLVEEFMLKANEIVAQHLSQLGKNLAYRVHDIPAEENMKDFAFLAGAFGFHLSEKPTPSELQKLFDEALKTSYGQYLATSYIRRMRLAIYSPDNIGHYGLGLTHYCHFTSPIRRYVDLVAHRILFGEADDRKMLDLIAEDCSEQERISSKAENSVVVLKKLRYVETLYKKEPRKEYEAIITRVRPFGVYFEVLDFMLESFLHLSELEDDYYVYEDSTISLRGKRTGRNYRSGDRIVVMLREVDMIMLESKWYLVDAPPLEKEEKRRPKPKKQVKKTIERRPPTSRHKPHSKPKKKRRK